jgi:hypothetical protein
VLFFTVPPVEPAADYYLRAVSLWDETIYAESEAKLSIENPQWLQTRTSVAPSAWALYP